jgi:hypothetical protein
MSQIWFGERRKIRTEKKWAKNKEKERDKDTDKDTDNDEQTESCGKCHTYESVKDEIQWLSRNGQRSLSLSVSSCFYLSFSLTLVFSMSLS